MVNLGHLRVKRLIAVDSPVFTRVFACIFGSCDIRSLPCKHHKQVGRLPSSAVRLPMRAAVHGECLRDGVLGRCVARHQLQHQK